MDPVGLAARARRHWLFGLVLVAALVLRILVALAFRPIMWFGGDSASYLATGLRLIPDPGRVGGYGFMLWMLRPLHSFALVAAVQHLMGLAMGVLIYLLARRYGLPAWAATLATCRCSSTRTSSSSNPTRCPTSRSASWLCSPCTCCCGHRANGGLPPTAAAAFLLGVSALLWPVGLALLGVLLVVLLTALLIRRAGLVTVLAALLAGALPVAAYSAWFSMHRAPVQPDQERRGVPVVADDVVRGLRGDQAAGRGAAAVPAAGTADRRVAVHLGRRIRRCSTMPARAVLGPDQPARAALRAAGHRRAAGRLRCRGRPRLQR